MDKQTLDFPVELSDNRINQFIDKDANHKYIKYVKEYWLDKQVWAGIQTKILPGGLSIKT